MKLMKTTSNQSKLGLLLMVVTQNMKAKETKKTKKKIINEIISLYDYTIFKRHDK